MGGDRGDEAPSVHTATRPINLAKINLRFGTLHPEHGRGSRLGALA
jgi:hypothetical protein